MEIRLLGHDEAGVLGRLADGVFDHPVNPRWAAEFLADPTHHLAVALDSGVVVGFASAVHYNHPDKPRELWIDELGVAPEHRRQGIARGLLRALLERARSLGCTQAWVLTEPENGAARALYASMTRDEAASVMYTFNLGGAPPAE
jgi:ribosomal protein S18 acetylase RimI-like enzyme